MDILAAVVKLRDDLKTWVANNINALNAKIDEKTIPIDDKLSSTSTNPVQNKVINAAIAEHTSNNNIHVTSNDKLKWDSKSDFSGSYNDLTDAPAIVDDTEGNLIIVDEPGNIIFKADAEGVHTTALTLSGEQAATEKYVDDAIAKIPTPDVSGQINTHNTSETAHADIRESINNVSELVGTTAVSKQIEDAIAEIPATDLSGYYNKEETDTAINAAKEELSESIVAESEEWKVVDEAGSIIFSVDASGAHTTELTLNGESAATEQWVENKNYLTEHQDISGKSDVGHKHVIADITDLPDYATINYVDTKVADLVNSAPEALNTLGELATALENHEDAYDALLETVGSKATKTELEDMKSELSESIVSETDEFHIVDESGNIVASIDENGVTTTTVTAQSVIVNGDSVEEHIDNTNIHVTTAEKEVWNSKSDFSGNYNDLSNKPTLFSGSYNDLTDKPEAADLSNYYTKSEVDTAIENIAIAATQVSGLATIATSGSINDVAEINVGANNVKYLVFNCGSATTLID